jgi:hypothetical protein
LVSATSGIYTITNGGSISAATAISVGGYGPVSVLNSGTLTGDVDLTNVAPSGLSVALVNTGQINGQVEIGDGDSLIDSRSGTITGSITLGKGNDKVLLGAGDEQVDAGDGTYVIDGGGGFDTVNFAGLDLSQAAFSRAGSAWSLVADGVTATLTDIQEVMFHDGAVYLNPGGALAVTESTDFSDYTVTAPNGEPVDQETVATRGGQTATRYLDGSGDQWAASVVLDLGAGQTERQYFDGAWNQLSATVHIDNGDGVVIDQAFDANWTQTGAVVTTNLGSGESVTQMFDGAWRQHSAEIDRTDANGDQIQQTFDAQWNQTGATLISRPDADTTITQAFDGGWNQTSAVIDHTDANGDEIEQDFDAQWRQTGAMLISRPDADTTITQVFDASWNQESAEIDTIQGSATTDRQFDGAWNLVGGTVTTSLGENLQRVDTYDSHWTLISSIDQAFAYGHAGVEVFGDVAGVSNIFVFHPGQIDGDVFSGFITAAMNPSLHDVMEFVGYGPDAHLQSIDASHWRLVSDDPPTEVFTLAGSLNPAAQDVLFR